MKFADPTKLDRKSGESGGICSSLNQQPILTEAQTLPFVIPTEAEGSAVPLNQHLIWTEAPPSLYHPDRAYPTTAPRAAFRKESRMDFANAIKLYRKSGIAQCRSTLSLPQIVRISKWNFSLRGLKRLSIKMS
jgi:hypothetical protein